MFTVTSKEVSEMLGKRHDNLLRAIRKYIANLGEDATRYFTEDPDKGGKMYHITKEGCDLMAGRIIGSESAEFKSKYLPLFGIEESVDKQEWQDPEMEAVEKAYTVDEVASILGMSERAVYRNIQLGKLGAEDREIKVPMVKKFVTESALEAFKAGRK